MIISLQLDGGKQENSKIRKLFETKRAEQIRPKMVEKPNQHLKKQSKQITVLTRSIQYLSFWIG